MEQGLLRQRGKELEDRPGQDHRRVVQESGNSLTQRVRSPTVREGTVEKVSHDSSSCQAPPNLNPQVRFHLNSVVQAFRLSTCESPALLLTVMAVAETVPVYFWSPTLKLTVRPLTSAGTNSGFGSSAPPWAI